MSESFTPACNAWTQGGKRMFDVLAATLLIVFFSPILLITAVLVRFSSPGPMLFSQIRSGRHGEPFRIYKFRSMRGGRTPDPREVVSLAHPEVTPIGRFIRRLKIDELPQIFSILSGTMSLVGPRPTLPDQVERYDDVQRRRLLVRPGITGLAQTHGNTSIDWNERIKYDVYYVAHGGMIMDAVILVRTLLVIFGGEERMAQPFDQSPFARKTAP